MNLYASNAIYAFLRRLDDELLVIVFNNGETTYVLDVPVKEYWADGAILRDLLEGGEATVLGGRLGKLSLPPRTGAILLSRPH